MGEEDDLIPSSYPFTSVLVQVQRQRNTDMGIGRIRRVDEQLPIELRHTQNGEGDTGKSGVQGEDEGW